MLHTNFKLDAAGESVVLADPGGAIVQQVNFGPQTAFQSFGRDRRTAATVSSIPVPR